MRIKMKKSKKILQNILIAATTIPMVVAPIIQNVTIAKAEVVNQIPELTAYQNGNGVKLEWSIEMLESDVLISTSFEEGQYIPSLTWGSNGTGGQSIGNEISQDGNRAYQVFDTINNSNHFSFPATSGNKSIMTWGRQYFENGTPLTISFYAKSDSSGTIAPNGDGGWANALVSFTGYTIAQTAKKGSTQIVLSAIPPSVKIGSHITSDTNPLAPTAMYVVREINNATNTITLSSALNRDLMEGEVLKTRNWKGAWSFNSRTVYKEDGWKRFSINTYVNNHSDYDIAVRGGSMYINTTTGGSLYIDNVKFGYASEAVVYKEGIQLYRGMLSDFNDTSAKDLAKPNAVTNVNTSMSGNKPVLSWTPSLDNGTSYSYTIKGVGKNGESPMSAPKVVDVKTGIKGYSVVFDQNPTTIPDNTIETTSTTFKSPSNMNANYYAHISAVDGAGNVSAPVHVQYKDIISPTLNVVASNMNLTNENITITATAIDDETGVKRIQKPDGAWVNGATASQSVTTNGDYTFISEDNAGNQTSRKITISNIDKIAPVVATLSSSTTAPTNGNVTVTINYPADGATKQYKIGSGGWTAYTTPVVVSTNSTVYARSIDAAGNTSLESNLVVSNIDKTPPVAATLVADKTTPTNGDVKVTITYPSDAVTKQYRVGSGAWTAYTASVAMTDNGIVYARSIDAAGNTSMESNLVVNNIDRIAPTAPTSKVIGNQLTITPGNDTSGIQSTQYQLNDGAWTTYSNVVTLPDGAYTINVKSIDNAGNDSVVVTTKVTIYVEALAKATLAVEEAELSPSQDKADKAQVLISALPESVDKTALQTRLDDVQVDIALNLKIQTEVIAMNAFINKGNLKKDTVKQYKIRLDQLLVQVSTLPNTMDKAGLNKQLDDLKAKLMLIENLLVVNSDGNFEDIDLEEIEELIEKLPDGDLKDDLQNQLDQAKDLQDALIQVEDVQLSKDQEDMDTARDAVLKLPNGQMKDDLNHRLEQIQKEIDDAKALADATDKVERADNSKTQADVDHARVLVGKLPDGQIKDDLNNRLDIIQKEINDANELADAIDKVQKAEGSKKQADVDNARDAVSKLPDGSVKNAYHKRLDSVDSALKTSTSKVSQAETYLRDPYLSDAQKLIGELKESPAKTILQERLDTIQLTIAEKAYQDLLAKAIQKVEQAEKYKRDPYITNAYDALHLLPSDNDKAMLMERLNTIVSENNPNEPSNDKDGQFVQGDNIVEVANSIKDSVTKKYYVDWANGVDRAERYFSKGNIVFAIDKMNAVPTEIRENPKYKALYEEMKTRSETLKMIYNQMVSDKELEKKINAAITALESYETYRSAFFKDKAQIAVDALTNIDMKTILQARMDAVVEKK